MAKLSLLDPHASRHATCTCHSIQMYFDSLRSRIYVSLPTRCTSCSSSTNMHAFHAAGNGHEAKNRLVHSQLPVNADWVRVFLSSNRYSPAEAAFRNSSPEAANQAPSTEASTCLMVMLSHIVATDNIDKRSFVLLNNGNGKLPCLPLSACACGTLSALLPAAPALLVTQIAHCCQAQGCLHLAHS